jgi:hypothetical protein
MRIDETERNCKRQDEIAVSWTSIFKALLHVATILRHRLFIRRGTITNTEWVDKHRKRKLQEQLQLFRRECVAFLGCTLSGQTSQVSVRLASRGPLVLRSVVEPEISKC